MGNTPSKELQSRPSHKLSKPRVVSFQTAAAAPPTAGPTRSSEPSPVDEFKSIPYSAISSNSNIDIDDSDHNQQKPDKPSPFVVPKLQRRLSLFRSSSSQEPVARRTSRRNTIVGVQTVPFHQEVGPVARANSTATYHSSDRSHRVLSLPGTDLPISEQYVLAIFDPRGLLSDLTI